MGISTMATVKYAIASPYVERPPLHPSDHKQADYEARLLGPEAGRGKPEINRVGLVLFGTGRQGFVHLGNIVGNPRVNLKYVIEADKSKWESTKENWNLENTTFLHPDEADKALSDLSVHAILVVTPTKTHCAIIEAGLNAGKHVFVRNRWQKQRKESELVMLKLMRWEDTYSALFREDLTQHLEISSTELERVKLEKFKSSKLAAG